MHAQLGASSARPTKSIWGSRRCLGSLQETQRLCLRLKVCKRPSDRHGRGWDLRSRRGFRRGPQATGGRAPRSGPRQARDACRAAFSRVQCMGARYSPSGDKSIRPPNPASSLDWRTHTSTLQARTCCAAGSRAASQQWLCGRASARQGAVLGYSETGVESSLVHLSAAAAAAAAQSLNACSQQMKLG